MIVLTRKIPRQPDGVNYALWNIKKKEIDIAAIQQADFIIHLAGAGVMDKRWTKAYKIEIVKSRTESSQLLADTLEKHPHKVKAIVSASGIGWYGENREGHTFTETDPPDNGFLGETCRLWEQSIEKAGSATRVVKLRTGIVLSNRGGILEAFKRPVFFGIAAILGAGTQVISWIHILDLCRMYLFAIENPIHGSFNAAAPLPVTNKHLSITLAKMLKGIFFIPIYIPEFLLRLILGKKSLEVLKSTTVSCGKIKNEGYTFLYPTIEVALQNLHKEGEL